MSGIRYLLDESDNSLTIELIQNQGGIDYFGLISNVA